MTMWRGLVFGMLIGLAASPAQALTYTVQEHFRLAGVTSDTLVKTGQGILHTVTCAGDAVPTVGTLEIRDGVAAGGGTVMQLITFAAAYFTPFTLTFDYRFETGLYLDFTTTADVTCSVSYR